MKPQLRFLRLDPTLVLDSISPLQMFLVLEWHHHKPMVFHTNVYVLRRMRFLHIPSSILRLIVPRDLNVCAEDHEFMTMLNGRLVLISNTIISHIEVSQSISATSGTVGVHSFVHSWVYKGLDI